MDYMTTLNLIYLGVIGLSFALVILAMMNQFAGRRKIMLLVFGAMLGMSYHAYTNLLSNPRPTETLVFDTPDVEKAKVIGVKMEHGKAIYILLDSPEFDNPRYFVYPWSDEMAEQLQEAMQENAENNGEGIEMELPFDNSLDRREQKWFHPIPQPKRMFPKQERQDEEYEFEHPSEEA
jgi:hypothetical protein